MFTQAVEYVMVFDVLVSELTTQHASHAEEVGSDHVR